MRMGDNLRNGRANSKRVGYTQTQRNRCHTWRTVAYCARVTAKNIDLSGLKQVRDFVGL